LGIVLKQAGQLAEAKTHLQLALEQGGPDAEVLYQLGLVLRQQGDLEAALVPLGQALELQPDLCRCRLHPGHPAAGLWPGGGSGGAVLPTLASGSRRLGRGPGLVC
jgi:hypothetical protein